MSISQQDNSLNGARNLGTLAGSLTRKGFVGQKDKIDFFSFTLSQSSDLSLSLKRSSVKANVKLELLNSAGTVLARSQRRGKKLEAIAASDLGTGTYYLGVRRVRGDTKYTLKTAATADPTPPDQPDPPVPPVPPQAIRYSDLGVLSGTSSLTNSVGNTSDASFKKYVYRFELSQISDLNANLGGLSDSVTLSLSYDANGNNQIDSDEKFASAFGSASQNASISTTFPKGTYFLELEYTGFTNPSTAYQLNLTQTPRPGNLPSDPSSSSNNAYDLGTLSGTLPTQIDLVGELDNKDFYKFKIDQIGDFNANLSGLSNPARMTLIYDANNNSLVDTNEPYTNVSGSSSQNGTISTPLAPGTYFIDLSYNGFSDANTRYELNLSYVANPGNLASDPSSSPNNPFNLGTISSTRTVIDLIGAFDNLDFYKFNLATANTLTVTLAGAFGGAGNAVFTDLYFDANRNNLIDSNERVEDIFGNVGSFTINNPAAGDYFIKVDSGIFPNVRYELTIGIG